jgi:hypothetical protein
LTGLQLRVDNYDASRFTYTQDLPQQPETSGLWFRNPDADPNIPEITNVTLAWTWDPQGWPAAARASNQLSVEAWLTLTVRRRWDVMGFGSQLVCRQLDKVLLE